MTSTNRDCRRGFTLLELMTVMIIVAIVLAAGITSYVGARRGMEMRGARSGVQSTLSLARQHAATKRRTTAVAFRLEGTTNCYYVFERIGKANRADPSMLYTVPPPLKAADGYWPSNGTVICKMSETGSRLGKLDKSGGYNTSDGGFTPVTWLDSGSGWAVGDAFGFQVGEKMFLPPGIKCTVNKQDNGIILFYANGKSAGTDKIPIEFEDKMGTDPPKVITVYPLVGLVKVEP
jgi:prepilin-type N-terminal cleavage/methylation domain-containing protein